MDPKRIFLMLVMAGSILINPLAYSESSGTSDFFLLTPNEAQRLRLSPQEWKQTKQNLSFGFGMAADQASVDGPRITIQSPRVYSDPTGQTIRCTTPFVLKVLFQENKAPVDKASLEVKAKKGIFSKSLTERLMPFFHQNFILAENIEIPPGHYCVVVSIADTNGRTTSQTYGLQVE